MKKIHYAWLICLAGILMMFCSIGLVANIFSVFQPFIILENGFSRTQGSLLVTVRMISALLSLIIVDWYYQKLDIKIGATIAICSIGISYIIYGLADNFYLFATGAFMSGIGYSLGAMIPVSIIIRRWFRSHLAFALGLCSAGTGIATVIMPPIATTLIEKVGLDLTFYGMGILVFILAIIIFVLIKNSPKDIGCEALNYGIEKNSKKVVLNENTVNMTKRDYIIMMISLFLLGGGGSNGFTHLGVLYSSEGYSSIQVATIISIAGFLLIIGKCTYGIINDKLGSYKSNYIFCTQLVLGFLGCCLAPVHNNFILFCALLALGFGFPTNNMGVPIWAKDLSDEKNYARTLKNFQFCYTMGTMTFSVLVGTSADIFHSYIPIYSFFTVIACLFMIILQHIYQKYKVATAK